MSTEINHRNPKGPHAIDPSCVPASELGNLTRSKDGTRARISGQVWWRLATVGGENQFRFLFDLVSSGWTIFDMPFQIEEPKMVHICSTRPSPVVARYLENYMSYLFLPEKKQLIVPNTIYAPFEVD